jgi:hypothetical protein
MVLLRKNDGALLFVLMPFICRSLYQGSFPVNRSNAGIFLLRPCSGSAHQLLLPAFFQKNRAYTVKANRPSLCDSRFGVVTDDEDQAAR